MNRAIGMSLILMFCITLFGAEVKNPDKPLKGTWDYKPEKMWGVSMVGEDPLVEVRWTEIDDAGNVYVLEGKQNKFYVFNPEGKLLLSFGKKGEGPGEIRFAFIFFIVGDQVIVPDMGRLHYFDKKSGTFIKSVILETMNGLMPREFIDVNRFVTVPDGEGSKSSIQLYDTTTKKRETILEFGAERVMDLRSEGEGRRMVVRILDPTTNPGIVMTLANNKLFIGKSDNYMFKTIDLKGAELFSFSLEGRKRRKITEEFKKSRADNMRLNGQKLPPDMAKQMIASIPDEATYFQRIEVDHKGNIYVYVTDLLKQNAREIDIFSPKGEYIYHSEIAFPTGQIIRAEPDIYFKDGFFYAAIEDEEGELELAKYKINTI
jgi:outer membrane protein assembly factor BamB